MDLCFLLEPFTSRTISSIWTNWYNFIKINASSAVKWCQSNFAHSWNYLAELLWGFLGFWEGVAAVVLQLNGSNDAVPFFSQSAIARLPNLRQRRACQSRGHCRKLVGLLLALVFCFWMGVSFWSWSKCVPFILIKTCLCFSDLVTFWTCRIKHNELFWCWPRKHMDLFLWLTKVLLLLPDWELWVCSLPVPSFCWLSKHLAISW